MNDRVYLISDDDEIYLGTVEEVLCSPAGGTAFSVILADIVGNLIGDPIEECAFFAIEIRTN